MEGVGAAKLFVLACGFAVVPCAAAFVDLCAVLGWLTRHRHRGAALGLALLVVAAVISLAGSSRAGDAPAARVVAVSHPLAEAAERVDAQLEPP